HLSCACFTVVSLHALLCFLSLRGVPSSTLFPYTTLFRSPCHSCRSARHRRELAARGCGCLAFHDGRALEHSLHPERRHRPGGHRDRKSTRLNSSHGSISYAVFCLKKKTKKKNHKQQKESR